MTRRISLLVLFVAAASLPLFAARLDRQTAARQPVTLHLTAVVGAQPFGCGRSYDGVGTTKSTISATDFRMYVSNLRAIDASGRDVPVTLTDDGKWQHGPVALLDFEDKTGDCTNGTPETRTVIEGSVPAGNYVGYAFNIGLPFEVNHRDPTLQPSPLNLTRLFWNWNAGYKFLRLDLKTTGQPQGWVLHLGSTGCNSRTGPTGVPTECTNVNSPEIRLAAFDPSRQDAQFDVAALLAESDVDVNQPDSAAGCMSGPTDADCAAMFAALGLPFGDAMHPGAQRVVRVVDHAAERR